MNALTSGCNSLEVIQFLFPLSHRVSNVKCIIRFELSSLSIHVLRSHAKSVCHRSMRAQYAWCQVLECSTLQLTALLRLTSSNPPALTGAEHTLICISSVISPPSSQPYTVHYCTVRSPHAKPHGDHNHDQTGLVQANSSYSPFPESHIQPYSLLI